MCQWQFDNSITHRDIDNNLQFEVQFKQARCDHIYLNAQKIVLFGKQFTAYAEVHVVMTRTHFALDNATRTTEGHRGIGK